MGTKRKAAPQVMFVPLKSTVRLKTYSANDPAWDDVRGDEWRTKGAIVRLLPPATATDEDIAYAYAAAFEHGALGVHTLPREPSGKPSVVEAGSMEVETKLPRQVVIEMVDGATASAGKKALRNFVEQVMAEEGL